MVFLVVVLMGFVVVVAVFCLVGLGFFFTMAEYNMHSPTNTLT